MKNLIYTSALVTSIAFSAHVLSQDNEGEAPRDHSGQGSATQNQAAQDQQSPLAQGDIEFSEWDEAGDGYISLAEWDAGIEEKGIFGRLDENANGIFDVEESDENLVQYDISWDLDDGGLLERQEFTVGFLGKYDNNMDDRLSEQEFDAFKEDLMNAQFVE